MNWRLDGMFALVTGGSKGIGKAIADEFLQLGATVCIVARNNDGVQTCVEAWRRKQLPAHGISADVKTDEGRQAILREFSKIHPSLNILVNNVGRATGSDIVDTSRRWGVIGKIVLVPNGSSFESGAA